MRNPSNDPDPKRDEVKQCARCGERTEHRTSIRIEQDTSRDDVRTENAKFSRQPFVVYCCADCGRSTTEKVS